MNAKNWKTCDREQFQIWWKEKLGSPNDVTREEVNRYLNRYFRDYNETRGYKKSARLVNDFFTPFMEYDPGTLKGKQRFAKKFVDAYTQVVPA